jgi:hypothetical protein
MTAGVLALLTSEISKPFLHVQTSPVFLVIGFPATTTSIEPAVISQTMSFGIGLVFSPLPGCHVTSRIRTFGKPETVEALSPMTFTSRWLHVLRKRATAFCRHQRRRAGCAQQDSPATGIYIVRLSLHWSPPLIGGPRLDLVFLAAAVAAAAQSPLHRYSKLALRFGQGSVRCAVARPKRS